MEQFLNYISLLLIEVVKEQQTYCRLDLVIPATVSIAGLEERMKEKASLNKVSIDMVFFDPFLSIVVLPQIDRVFDTS